MLKVSNLSNFILKNIDFDLNKWEILALIWHNWCGKTTLLKSIIWLEKYEWDIFFNDQNINSLSISERSNLWLAYLMQEVPEYTWITIINYIKWILKEKFNLNKISDIFLKFWLNWEWYKNRYFDWSLSWWERKKIEIITTLLLDKQVYLFDEVENSLDIYSQNYLKQVIQDFAKEWKSFVIVSHNENILNLAQSAILMCNWKKESTWDIRNLLSKYKIVCNSCSKCKK